jgi:hypothetical protein
MDRGVKLAAERQTRSMNSNDRETVDSLSTSLQTLTVQSDSNTDGAKPEGIRREQSHESLGNQSQLSKASLTKIYMENKYKKYDEQPAEEKKSDVPPIVVHGGDDDQDEVQTETTDAGSFVAEQLEDSKYADSGEDTFDQTALDKLDKSKESKKKDKSSSKGSVRGWSLFGTQRGAPKAGSRNAKGGDLGIIDEKDQEGTIKRQVFRLETDIFRGGNDKRRKSVQDVFGRSPGDTSTLDGDYVLALTCRW